MSSPGDEGGSRASSANSFAAGPAPLAVALHSIQGLARSMKPTCHRFLARPQCRLIWIRAWRADRLGIDAATTAAGCNHRRAPGFDRLARSCSAGGRSTAPCGCVQSVRSLPARIPQNRPCQAQPLPFAVAQPDSHAEDYLATS